MRWAARFARTGRPVAPATEPEQAGQSETVSGSLTTGANRQPSMG
jgi:hypothetical protein